MHHQDNKSQRGRLHKMSDLIDPDKYLPHIHCMTSRLATFQSALSHTICRRQSLLARNYQGHMQHTRRLIIRNQADRTQKSNNALTRLNKTSKSLK